MNRDEKDLVESRVLTRCGILDRNGSSVSLVLEDLKYWEIVESLIETLDVLKVRGVSMNDPTYARASNVLLKVLNRIY